MNNDNVKRIMAIAKAEKPKLRIVITVIDEKEKRRQGTKIGCFDSLGNIYKVDELDESLVVKDNSEHNTLFLSALDEETMNSIFEL